MKGKRYVTEKKAHIFREAYRTADEGWSSPPRGRGNLARRTILDPRGRDDQMNGLERRNRHWNIDNVG